MGLLARLKGLWKLSKKLDNGTATMVVSGVRKSDYAGHVGEDITDQVFTDPSLLKVTSVEQIANIVLKPKGMATVVKDDPVDLFPDKAQQDDKTS